MPKIKEILNELESWAPKAYAESYDNPGLIVGDSRTEVKGVLVSLDCTEEVIDEAIKKGCNLILSHHPIVFKGLKRLNGSNYVERTVIKAIKNDIALYAIHTNLDNVPSGVNKMICDKIGLIETRILRPKDSILEKIEFFVPTQYALQVRDAIFLAGGGEIGDYSKCSFNTEGTGTFMPGESSNPHIGKQGEIEEVLETRVEIMYPSNVRASVLKALKASHPYEEVAYYIHNLANSNQYLGSGMVGKLEQSMMLGDFLSHLKEVMELKIIRHTKDLSKPIKTVALCGGSGSFLLGDAKSAGADIFITGDFKYHEFFDAENAIVIADIGHYESERFTVDLLGDFIRKKFSTFATHFTEVNTNPIHYS